MVIRSKKIFLATCIAFLPAIMLAVLLINYSVNVPFWDQWTTPAAILIKFHQGDLTLGDLLAQHNESRKFFPKLLFIALAQLNGWNIQFEILITFLLACFISYCVYKLSWYTLRAKIIHRFIYLLLANCLIFNPLQYENWLWGIQLITFVPIACIISCFLILLSKKSSSTKFLTCTALCIVSTFTFANGILSWIVVAPYLMLKISKLLYVRVCFFLGWFLIFSGNIVVYFYNYDKPDHHPSFYEALQHPIKAIRYFISFLGAPLASHNLVTASILGSIFLLLFLFIFLYSIFSFKKSYAFFVRILPWLSIASYSLLSALITTSGRAGFGIEQSLASRYITFSSYLPLALVFSIPIFVEKLRRRKSLSSTYKLFRYIIPFLIFTFVLFYILSFTSGVRTMANLMQERLYGKACLILINHYVDDDCLSYLFPDKKTVKNTANTLNLLGVLRPRLAEGLSDLEGFTNSMENERISSYGFFESLETNSNGDYMLRGWAISPRRKRLADAVVISFSQKDGSEKILKVVKVGNSREDVPKVLGNKRYINSGWQTTILKNQIPSDSLTINAWAFDTQNKKMFKLHALHNGYVFRQKKQFQLSNSSNKPRKIVDSIDPSQLKDINYITDKTNDYIGSLDLADWNKDELTGQTQTLVSGWVANKMIKDELIWVLLTSYPTNKTLAITKTGVPRPDVANYFQEIKYQNSGWSIEISSNNLSDIQEIQAWVYDPKANSAFLIGSSNLKAD